MSVLLSVFFLYEGQAVTNVDQQPGLASDAKALLAVRDSFERDDKLNWAEDTPIEVWDGVRVADSPRRVTRLSLKDRKLAGTVSPQLGGLAKLTQLDLRNNHLSGAIPSELGGLVKLERIRLSGGNLLTGCVPAGLEKVPDSDLSELNLETCESS